MNKAFSIIEIILAAALFVIFSSGAMSVVLFGFDMNRVGSEQTIATQYAIEGLEAARSIKNQSFINLQNSPATGIVRNVNGLWSFSGSNNSFEKYLREIKIEDVNRDVNGNIVLSGGTTDVMTKKVTSTVSWTVSGNRNNSVVLTTYLSDWKKPIIGNWANPSQQSMLDFSGNSNGVKIFVQGNYAYVIRDSGTPNFIIVNISNQQSLVITGSLTLTNSPTNIFVSGNYAYVSSRDNSAELQILDISNPNSPSIIGSYNAAGNNDANAVFVEGTNVFLVRDSGANPEFYVINATSPSSPALLGSLNLSGNLEGIFVLGGYAYVASSDNNSELQIINISNSNNPVFVNSLNLAGNNDALSIAAFANTAVVGRIGGDVLTIDVTNPAALSILGSINVGGDVNDISLGNNNSYAFLATANATTEFQVLNISNLSAPVILGTLNMPATENGVYYDSVTDRAYLVGINNSGEMAIIQPN